MKKEWYVLIGDQQHGPYASAEMEQYYSAGKIEPRDLVWRDGMTDWVPVVEVIAGRAPQPLPRTPAPPPRPARGEPEAIRQPPQPRKDAAPALPDLDVPDLEPIAISPDRLASDARPKPGVRAQPRSPNAGTNVFTQKVSPWWWLALPAIAAMIAIIIVVKTCSNSDDGATASGVGLADDGSETNEYLRMAARSTAEWVTINGLRKLDYPEMDPLIAKTPRGEIAIKQWQSRWCATNESSVAFLRSEGVKGPTLYEIAKEKGISFQWPCTVSDLYDIFFVCSVNEFGSPDFLLLNTALGNGHLTGTKPIAQGTFIVPKHPPDEVMCNGDYGEPMLTLIYRNASGLTLMSQDEFKRAIQTGQTPK